VDFGHATLFAALVEFRRAIEARVPNGTFAAAALDLLRWFVLALRPKPGLSQLQYEAKIIDRPTEQIAEQEPQGSLQTGKAGSAGATHQRLA
jgi:hypothetical protein